MIIIRPWWKFPDIDNENRSGDTMLVTAARNGASGEILRLLLCGADPDQIANSRKQNALVTAAHNDFLVGTALLLAFGADVNSRMFNGATALMAAADDGTDRMMRLLLNRGAEVNAVANDGSTALMRAGYRLNTTKVHLLLVHGADRNAVDRDGRGVWDYVDMAYQEWDKSMSHSIDGGDTQMKARYDAVKAALEADVKLVRCKTSSAKTEAMNGHRRRRKRNASTFD